ncbi:hypothetical protein ACQF36_37500 [Streptomyces sp. Marseille-Q5077]|uniref:hypothetical protein n=1 Tax=Streptomyces sp. Marseille-Q5077 TaxID=3418995 RepID=UPI003D0843E9
MRTGSASARAAPAPWQGLSVIDVIWLYLHNAIDEHLEAVARRLAEGHDPAGAVAKSSVAILSRFIADEDNTARLVRSFRSPNFDDPGHCGQAPLK